jgi:hypothetical protein
MGYYSLRTLSIKDQNDDDLEDHDIFFEKLQEAQTRDGFNLDYDIESIASHLEGEHELKWYEDKKDLLLISTLPDFKDWKFVLTRTGEEFDDIWD